MDDAKPITAILSAYVFFGLIGIFSRLLAVQLTQFEIVFSRLAIAVVFVFAVGLAFKKDLLSTSKNDLKSFLLLGFLMYCSLTFLVSAYFFTSVANVALITFFGPIITVILASTFIKEKISKRETIGITLGISGIIVMFAFQANIQSKDTLGILFAVANAASFGSFVFFTKWLRKNHETDKQTFWSIAFATIFIIPTMFLLGTPEKLLRLDSNGVLWIAGIGILCTGLAYLFLNYGSKYVKAARMSIMWLVEPLAAILLAFIVFAEIPAPSTIAGGLLIIAANLAIIKEKNSGKPHCCHH